jgi:hypothetical protein
VSEPYDNDADKEPTKPTVKRVKVDQAIVAFLPSHIRKRKATVKATRPVKLTKPSSGLDDDYQRLLREVGED